MTEPAPGAVRRAHPHNASPDRRSDVEAKLSEGRIHAAIEAARLLLNEQPSVLNQRFVRRLVQATDAASSTLKPLKVALLSSFSIEFVHDALIAQGFANGLRTEIYQPAFDQIRQEILNPQSRLYAFEPDIVVIAVEGGDWLPEVYAGFMDAGPDADGMHEAGMRFVADLTGLAHGFRRQSSKPLLVHNVAPPRRKSAGIADSTLPASQHDLIAGLNRGLAEAMAQVTDAYVLDYAGLVAELGSRQWYDTRMRLYARMPIAAAMLGALAREYMKYFRALTGLTKKCLVVDLDNTLWGGVIGEDGLDGIQLGPTYPGSAFVEFQRAVLDLHRRGVILAIASKNNQADVDAVFARHKSMLLEPLHFAAAQVHWEAKVESLVRIAAQLGVGLEHMVFADDNPAECELIRRELPAVTVIDLPRRPELYVDALLDEGLFDTVRVSDEDRRRGALYRQRALAQTLRGEGGSLEDYYRSLAMELSIAPIDETTLARAAQLTRKTNQFNLTTLRYSEAELAVRKGAPDWVLLTVGVRDRFGDNGTVGVVMAQARDGKLDIDTFLLSCRIIGRTVETAMLAHLCTLATERGIATLSGQLRPTARNMPAQDMFERHGFAKVSEDRSGNSIWELPVRTRAVECPDWFAPAA